MNSAMNLATETFDAIIVGGGGAGLRASLELAQSGLSTAVISKVFQRVHILFQHKAALMLHSVIPMVTMIGAGICMTPWSVLTF